MYPFNNDNQSPQTPRRNVPSTEQQPDMGDPNVLNNPAFFSYFNNLQIPSPPPQLIPQVFYNNMSGQNIQPNMGFGMWSAPPPPYGFQNMGGLSQGATQRNTRPTTASPEVEVDVDVVPETQVPRGDDCGEPQKKKRAHKRKPPGEARLKTKSIPWSPSEEMNLAKAWLEITEDPAVANYQKEKTYWARILRVFLSLEDKPEGYRDADCISAKWRKIRPMVQAFNEIYTRLNNARQSGGDDAMVQANAQTEYQLTKKGGSFPYLAIWQYLRRSSKFASVISLDAKASRGQPSSKRSKTSSSNDPHSQASDARCTVNLNDTDEEYEEHERGDDPVEPPQRPIGRDRAKKGGQSSSSGGRIDYTETFDKVTAKLDGLLQATQQRITLKKEHGDRKLKLKESRQKALDLQILTTDTSGLSGAELALAEQMKQEIREKYNL